MEQELLASCRQLSREEFASNRGIQHIVSYAFLVVAQACMDIAAHIITNT